VQTIQALLMSSDAKLPRSGRQVRPTDLMPSLHVIYYNLLGLWEAGIIQSYL